jgi:hypothetical protein
MIAVEQTLPFGKHRGVALARVPTGYLRWVITEVRLSSGLRQAVEAALRSRGVEVAGPSAWAPPHCRRCGDAGATYQWLEDRLGRPHVRASCAGCGSYLALAPCREPFTTLADESSRTEPGRPAQETGGPSDG